MATYSSFPHPVLGNRNNVAENLELLQPTYTPAAQEVHVHLPIACDSAQMNSMLRNGDARIVITWDCPTTMSRGIADTQVSQKGFGWECDFYLIQEEISGLVSIDASIIATRAIDEFKWDAQHPIYRDSSFDISEGDILGILGGFDFEARKLYDAMDPPLGSLFVVHTSPGVEPISVEYDESDDHILIQISQDMAKGINQLGNGNFDATKIAFIVFPALIDTLNLMSRAIDDKEQEHYLEKRWFKALQRRVDDLKLDIHNAVPTAQVLLSNISTKALAEFVSEEGDR